ncbi:MAG TPA: hypothetical protein VNT55_00070, partial [Baekduia sp.]|nr:hypothetical protein [Baekduia sp.]
GQDGARCAARRGSLQAAGVKLSRLQRTLARRASASTLGARQKAPKLTVSGTTLKWAKVADVTSYVMVTKVAGKSDQYSVVTGTSTTPAAQTGKTVSYALRTAVVGSAWSNEAKIAYAAPAQSATDAPTLSADGQTLRWTKVAGVNDYYYVIKVPGTADVYKSTTGTSLTPPAVAGQTVRYSVRTAVDGSNWAKEVAITYPAGATTTPAPSTGSGSTTPTPTPSPDPTPAPAPSTSATFTAGVVAGGAPLGDLANFKTLGAKSARVEFDIDTPASGLASVIDAYAKAGIQPLVLAGFQGRTPTAAEGRNLATWAATYGPGGTFWAGKSYPAGTAVTRIEFGNETNQAWQYSQLQNDPNWANTSFYASLAQGYATAFKAGSEAIKAANPGVGLLAIGDTPGNWASWFNNIYKAVPNFADYVSGWVMHPYGPAARWQPIMDNALAQVTAHGAPKTIPIYVTEYGIASDNGRCLDDNYGWDTCMTYDQAGAALTSTVAAMRARYGSRLAAMYLYQVHDQKTTGTSTSRESYFGGLTVGGAAKGAYTTAMTSLLAA